MNIDLVQLAGYAAQNHLLPYALLMQPNYETPPHLRLLARKLEAVERGEITRLIVTLPPRHGKSNLISELFPAWYLGKRPNEQVMFATYGQDLADGFGRKVRNHIASPQHQTLFLASRLADDSKSANKFSMSAGGVYNALGVGGPGTGKGADCIAEGTLIETAAGPVPIENLQIGALSGKILSLNKERLEYRDLKAIVHRSTAWLYRFTTSTGRVLEVTGEHRVLTGRGYVTADDIAPGDTFVFAAQVPETVHPAGVRSEESTALGVCGSLLFEGMLRSAPRSEERQAVQSLRQAGSGKRGRQECDVLQAVQAKTEGAEAGISSVTSDVSCLQHPVRGEVARQSRGKVPDLLQQALRGDRAFKTHDGRREPEMEERGASIAVAASLRKGFSSDAGSDPGTGQPHLRSLPSDRPPARSPLGRVADEQHDFEPCDPVQFVPSPVARGEGFEAFSDTVALVERVHKACRVYDVQVEGNQNLFANGICVHNCLIVDDALKNREEADSKTIRDKVWDWYAAVAYTRLMPGARIVIVHTRWQEDDLIGRLLKGHEQFELLNLPAVAEENDALGRKPGEALWPERYNKDDLQRIRYTIGEREFAALYQQRPAPLEGALFRRSWIQRATAPRAGARIAMGVDLALSTKQGADYTAIVVVARDEVGKIYVLDAVRQRADFPTALGMIREMAAKWKPIQIGIESVAYQAVVVQELLRTTTLPIRGITPDRDKMTRATPVALRYEQGMIYHADLPSWFEDELLAFPQGEHDDAVDALVYAYLTAMKLGFSDDIRVRPSDVEQFEPMDEEIGL